MYAKYIQEASEINCEQPGEVLCTCYSKRLIRKPGDDRLRRRKDSSGTSDIPGQNEEKHTNIINPNDKGKRCACSEMPM